MDTHCPTCLQHPPRSGIFRTYPALLLLQIPQAIPGPTEVALEVQICTRCRCTAYRTGASKLEGIDAPPFAGECGGEDGIWSAGTFRRCFRAEGLSLVGVKRAYIASGLLWRPGA